MPTVNAISVEKAKILLDEGKNMLVLDKRDVQSYKQGHIDGAMMAHDELIEALIKQGDKQKPILVYCYQGESSKDIAGLFSSCGFKEVYSMEGGYAEWKRLHA